MRKKYQETPPEKTPLKENPYNKPNPYKLKPKLHSTQSKLACHRYLSSASLNQSHNPESLFYKRNYKQTPVNLPNNYVPLLQQSRLIMGQNYGFAGPEIDYKVKFNNYLAEKFCPTDGYLDALKDKFTIFATDKDSQFQNLMKTSHITKLNSNDRDLTHRSFPKQNPFLRKSLIHASTERSTGESLYSSMIHGASNYISTSQVYNDPYGSYVSPKPYDYTPPICTGPDKDLNQHIKSSSAQSTNDDKKQHKNGSETWLQGRKKVYSFVDALIETSLTKNDLEENAPKQIRIKGKKFFMNNVRKVKA